MKLRTLTVIILAILVIAGIIFYFITRRGNNSATTTGQTGSLPSTTSQSFPSASNQNTTTGTTATATGTSATFGIVSNDPAFAYFVDNQNNVTLIEPDGPIETIANGVTNILSSTTIPDLITASFSYDGKKLLVSSGSSSDPTTSVLDLASGFWLQLPAGMESPVWSPTNYQIAYLTPESGGTETLFTATVSTTTVKTVSIENFATEDSLLQWPSKNTIIISDKPSAFTVSSAFAFNVPLKTIAPLVIEYPGMESIWSGTTPMMGLIFSGNSGDQGGNLALMNAVGAQTALTFTTLPSKCLFNMDVTSSTPTSTAPLASSTTSKTLTTSITTTTLNLYCAIPRDQSTLGIARLPDEYDQKVLFTADDFYSVNAATGAMSTVFSDPNQTLDATDLKIANGVLFFVNRYDQKLYAIKLTSS